ncbi:MAG: hypothetical protein HXX20_02210 [Chloroflexi bacterium]|nr:hypothetical protein [Chloroflexota bacterium]
MSDIVVKKQLASTGALFPIVMVDTGLVGGKQTYAEKIQQGPINHDLGGASGKYFDMLASAALSSTGTTVLTLYPALTPSANAIASDVLPRTFRVKAVVAKSSGTAAVTATVGAIVIL